MFGKDKQNAGHGGQQASGEKISKKDLPLLNDLQAAMQHEKHRGMSWTISLLAVFLSRRLSRPIQAVTAAAHELARGNLAVALPVTSQDEVGRLTTALNELSRELQKTDQLRKELIANVSHELRAPLAVIKGYAETVRDVTWPQEDKRRSYTVACPVVFIEQNDMTALLTSQAQHPVRSVILC